MLRAILAGVVSYLVLMALIVGMFLVATLALGIEGTLRPGEYWTSSTFNAIVFAGGTVFSVAAGALCGWIARSPRPALVVAVLMAGFGLVRAVQNSGKADPPPRPGPNAGETASAYATRVLTDMQTVGKEPAWFAFTVPIVGAAAFAAGSMLVAGRRRPPAATHP
jgi:hypothetical protein